MTRLSTTAALKGFLDWYLVGRSIVTVKIARGHLQRIIGCAGREWLDELSRADIEHCLGGVPAAHRRVATTMFRQFARWCAEERGATVWMPPSVERIVADKTEADGERLLVRAHAIAERLVLPHQRFIFLNGFLYGLPLSLQVRYSAKDFLANDRMHRDYYDLLSALHLLNSASGPLLRPWLGNSLRGAERRWQAWSGGLLKFRFVIEAGDYQKNKLGYRASVPRRQAAQRTAWIAPLLDAEGVAKMPRFWEA